ncbi:hypothetical protein KKF29_00055, partial [Patescibacteria group bacterium]|nr:hypothetical protein [Patescibacteria group bacterium]
KCKCTTPWIAGIAIGVAIATVSCLVYFFVLDDGCMSGNCEAFVAKQLPTINANTNKTLELSPEEIDILKHNKILLLDEFNNPLPEFTVESEFEQTNQCIEDCMNGIPSPIVVGEGDVYSQVYNPTDQQCEQYCGDLYGTTTLYQYCLDWPEGGGGMPCEDGMCIDDTLYARCMDCGTGEISYQDAGNCDDWGVPN